MKPEFTAYQAGAHARVKCVECHVGPGADWYVKSKLSGAYQLCSVSFNKYPRLIKSPVYVPPDRAVNDSLNAGKLDPSLPYIKRQAVEVLTCGYQTTDEAVAAIGRDLEGFYRQNYADVYAQKPDAVRPSQRCSASTRPTTSPR